MNTERTDSSQGEVILLWALWAAFLAALFATYSRHDPENLYHVSRDGFAGGLSRTLIAIDYPVALFAIAAILLALRTLDGWWRLPAVPGVSLCAVTAIPGVVDPADLDARPINIVPALGVLIAVAMTLVAARRGGASLTPAQPLDRARAITIALVGIASLPWIFATLGFYLPEVGFISAREITGSDGAVNPAVHLGDHHGFTGALLLVSAIVFSRCPLHPSALGRTTAAYVALMAAYGGMNFVQDFTHEQMYKRDWVSWRIPDAQIPSPSAVWAVIVALAVVGYLALVSGIAQPRVVHRHQQR